MKSTAPYHPRISSAFPRMAHNTKSGRTYLSKFASCSFPPLAVQVTLAYRFCWDISTSFPPQGPCPCHALSQGCHLPELPARLAPRPWGLSSMLTSQGGLPCLSLVLQGISSISCEGRVGAELWAEALQGGPAMHSRPHWVQ